jgi:putative transcriptional regulator
VVIKVRLEELLKERGRSLYWLGKEAGVSYTTLWKLKTGETQGISFEVLDKLCEALDCAPGDLLARLTTKKK